MATLKQEWLLSPFHIYWLPSFNIQVEPFKFREQVR